MAVPIHYIPTPGPILSIKYTYIVLFKMLLQSSRDICKTESAANKWNWHSAYWNARKTRKYTCNFHHFSTSSIVTKYWVCIQTAINNFLTHRSIINLTIASHDDLNYAEFIFWMTWSRIRLWRIKIIKNRKWTHISQFTFGRFSSCDWSSFITWFTSHMDLIATVCVFQPAMRQYTNGTILLHEFTWWRHQMETLSA